MKLHVYRYLYRAGLYLKAAVKVLRESRVNTLRPPLAPSPRFNDEIPAGTRFFFIAVEMRQENETLIRLMRDSPAAAAQEIQLPPGCRFRTCFETSADYAENIINMCT